MKQLFGVGLSAGPERAVFSEVLMYYRHLTAFVVKVCYDLAPGAGRFPGMNRTRVAIPEGFGREFSSLNFLGITAAVEQFAYFFG